MKFAAVTVASTHELIFVNFKHLFCFGEKAEEKNLHIE